MRATLKFAIAVLVAVLAAGCTTYQRAPDNPDVIVINKIDPGRPYPPQPDVPTNIMLELVSKRLQDFDGYMSPTVVIRDGSDFDEISKKFEVEQGKEKSIPFENFPRLLNPSPATTENAKQFMVDLRGWLDSMGVRRVETPCETCLIFLIEYIEPWVQKGPMKFFVARVKVFYHGQEVAVSRGDRLIGWKKGLLFGPDMKDAIKLSSKRTAEELLNVWNWRVASWRQQLGIPAQQAAIQGE